MALIVLSGFSKLESRRILDNAGISRKIAELLNSPISVSTSSAYPDDVNGAAVDIKFASGAMLRANYWRIVKDGRHFDDGRTELSNYHR
jgi:hypothetical protein